VEGQITHLKFLKMQMYGLALTCFARASYAELDPATTQSVHEPEKVHFVEPRQYPTSFGEGRLKKD
jgi:hypothetical protein